MGEREILVLKIDELEEEYRNIDLTQDEIDLSKIQRKYDDKLSVINAKKSQRDIILKDLEKYRSALNAIEELIPSDEEEDKEVEEDLEDEAELN